MMMRLGEACGLMICDIDLAISEIKIRHNKVRRVKNEPSNRELLIHPEILRLGFGEFVEQQKALGHEILFPELYGSATAATVKFNKEWIKKFSTRLFRTHVSSAKRCTPREREVIVLWSMERSSMECVIT